MRFSSVAAAALLSVPLALPAPAAAAAPSADFDGDGYADLAIGAPTDSVAGQDSAGAVNVIYGGPHGLHSAGNQEFTQASPGVGDAPQLGDRFGAALAAGDFDGDGYADLAVGVPGEGVPTGVGQGEVARASAGMVQVLYGSRDGLRGESRLGWTQDRPGVKGTTHARDGFGGTLAAGDFDGDGRADLAIGTPLEPLGDRLAAGAVNVLYGSASGLTAAGDQLWTLDSPGIKGVAGGGFRFGWALAAGDVSGDGRDDLAIGVPGGRISGRLDAGAVTVLYSRAGGLSAVDDLWSQDARGIKGRAERLDNFGTAVAIGDLDADGIGDLAIGVQFEDVGAARDAGAVNVLYGSRAGLGERGDQLWTENTPGIRGAAARRDRFGATLTIADFSRNGVDDLAIGVPGEDVGAAQDAGAVNLLYGSHERGLRSRGNQRWTQDARGVKSRADAADLFGTALAAGDFDGDGASDLAVGAPHETVAGHGLAGAVNVLPGSRRGLRSDPDELLTQATAGIAGAVGSDSLGTALAATSRN